VDWDADQDPGRDEYHAHVMTFHLVNAAHSIVRMMDPSLHSNRDGDPVKLVRLRDISIGLRDNKSSRIVVECMASPGTIHVSEGYHPRWDIDSDDEDDLSHYEGNSKVLKERNMLKNLLDRARSRSLTGRPSRKPHSTRLSVPHRCRKAHSRWKAHAGRIGEVRVLGGFGNLGVRQSRALNASHSGNRGTYDITHNNPKVVGG
jgi:hypothetical protein